MARKTFPSKKVSEELTEAAQKGGKDINPAKSKENQQHPSKENGDKALNALRRISDSMDPETRLSWSASFIQIEEFLEAAIRKLPHEESFVKEKERKPKHSASSDTEEQDE